MNLILLLLGLFAGVLASQPEVDVCRDGCVLEEDLIVFDPTNLDPTEFPDSVGFDYETIVFLVKHGEVWDRGTRIYVAGERVSISGQRLRIPQDLALVHKLDDPVPNFRVAWREWIKVRE